MSIFGDISGLLGLGQTSGTRGVHTTSTGCKAVILHYLNQKPDDSDLETEVVRLGGDHSSKPHNPILSFTYQKNLGSPFGEFVLELADDRNFYKHASPGDWISIYLTQGAPSAPSSLSTKAEKTQSFTIGAASSTNSGSSGIIPGGGGSRTYQWTQTQINRWKTLEADTNQIWSGNILAKADEFDAQTTSQSASSSDESSTIVDSGGWSLRCLGNITRIQKKITVSNDGTRQTTWVISGADWGKFFYTLQFAVHHQLAQDQIFNFTVKGQTAELKGSSSELVRNYINFFLRNRSQSLQELAGGAGTLFKYILKMPSKFKTLFFPDSDFDSSETASLYDILKNRIEDNAASGELTYALTLDTLQPLWSVIKQLSNPAINELYLEMIAMPNGEKNVVEMPAVFMRPIPFSLPDFKEGDAYNKQFMSLPEITIDTSSIIESSTGISDNQRKNWFFLESYITGSSIGKSAQIYPTANPGSVERYGPGILRMATEFADYSEVGAKLLVDWNALIKHWYENNHLLEDGYLVINGSPFTRVGNRLTVSGLYNSQKILKTYYIEGYVDQWQFPGLWTQTVIVTRGMGISENGKPFYLYELESDENVRKNTLVRTGNR